MGGANEILIGPVALAPQFHNTDPNCGMFFRYAIESGNEDQLSARKYLELARATEDKQVLSAVTVYFANRITSGNGAVVPYR